MADVTARLRLVVDSTGTGRANKDLEKIRKNAKSADDSAARLKRTFASLGAVLGAGFSIRSIQAATEAFNEQARAVAKVEQAIKSTAGAAGFTARELQKLATQLQSQTLFGDEQILNDATAQLLTFTNIAQEQFKRTQSVALDLATVLDSDLKSASIQLGKALNDPVKNLSALSRSGIQFSESQKRLIESLAETGRLAEAQGVILDELERQYGGQAEAAAAAGTGILTQLKNLFGDIRELLGERFVDAIRKPAEALRDFLSVTENQQKVANVIQNIAAALGILAAPVLVGGIVSLAGALASLVSPVGLVAGAIVGLVSFRDDIAEWAFGVRDAGAVIQASFEVLGPIIKKTGSDLAKWAKESYQVLHSFADGGAALFTDLQNSLSSFIPPQALETVKTWAKSVLDVFFNLAKGIAEVLADAMLLPVRAIAKLYDAIGKIDLLPDNLQAQFRATANQFRDFANAIDSNAGRETIEAVASVAKNAIDSVKTIADATIETYDKIKNRAAEIAASNDEQEETIKRISESYDETRENVDGITGALTEQTQILQQQRNILGEPFFNLANNIESAIRTGGKRGVESLKEIFSSFLQDLKGSFLTSIFDPILQGIRNIGANLLTPAGGIAGGAGLFGLGAIFGKSGSLAQTGEGMGFLLRQAGLGVDPDMLGNIFRGAGTGLLAGTGVNLIGDLFGVKKGNTGASIGGVAGGILGSVIPGIGTVLGSLVGSTLGKVFGSLFAGKPSNKVGQVYFDPISGQVLGSGQKDNSQASLQNLEIAKAISAGVSDAVGQIADIVGAESAALINVAAGNRNGIVIGLQAPGVIKQAQTFENSEAGAQKAVDAGIKLALQNLRGGDKMLTEIVKALSSAGKPLDEIAATVSNIAELTKASEKPLSEYQQRIKDINETFDDALQSVKGIASAEKELTAARKAALKQVTGDYNQQIQDDIAQYLNGPTDQLERLLKAQGERLEEAQALGADMAEVERLTNLELRQFFQGLSDSALEEVQSFLGLFEEASNSVARQLDLSRQDLEGVRDSFSQFAQDFADLRTDWQERFVSASPRESIDILRARANDLLGQVGDGNASAAQALPQVLNSLVENARQSFGNTKQFQEVLDFANEIARQAEDASLGVVSDAERQIQALDENNDILSDIRDILASSQATSAFFQSYSSGGVASADELLNLIQSGAGLTLAANDNAAAINVTSLIAQSISPIITPLANSIDGFTQELSDMPGLQRLTIEATYEVRDSVNAMSDRLHDKLDRLEILEKKQLDELENAA